MQVRVHGLAPREGDAVFAFVVLRLAIAVDRAGLVDLLRRIAPLVPDAETANKKWAETHGGVPVNHMVIVRETIANERPDVVEEIFRVFKAARQADTAAPKGKQDPYRFGVEANREALERIIDYSVQQQMIPKKIAVDDLFNDVTRKLV